jgi:hypothetical protein
MAALLQIVIMAAIVATMLVWPAGVVLALALSLFGVGIDAFITFGGALNRFTGLVALWVLAFAGAVPYAVFTAFNAPVGARSFPCQKKR